jgi:myosin heavy subunit
MSILFSGESGSGKTKAANKLISHLLDEKNISAQKTFSSLEAILAFFGCAKTTKNTSSNRFTKVVEIKLDQKNELFSVFFSIFFFESRRVTRLARDSSSYRFPKGEEWNFNVFHSLMAAAPSLSAEEKEKWGIATSDPHNHRTTNCLNRKIIK